MNSIFTIIILLGAVVIANVIHLVWSRVPLSLYQILAGIIIALLPTPPPRTIHDGRNCTADV